MAFAVLFIIGWFASGGDAPDYGASDQAWTDWADDNQWKSRIGAVAMLLAGFVLLHFAGMIRSVLGRAESPVGGSAQLARTAFGGAVTGMTGMATAIVIIASSDSEGAAANPVITRAVASASAGPFLVSAMGFAAFLGAAGLLTLRTGVFARWTGIVALIGAVSFLITFVAVLDGLGEDSLSAAIGPDAANDMLVRGVEPALEGHAVHAERQYRPRHDRRHGHGNDRSQHELHDRYGRHLYEGVRRSRCQAGCDA